MKITMYELLGLVKDGKAPKKIKYNDLELDYDKENEDYWCYYGSGLFKYKFITRNDFLNDEVEIIEESKKIEKIEIDKDDDGQYFFNDRYDKIYIRCDETDFMVDKFNELIDEINNLKEK